WMIWHNNVYIF
nr:immunoglobulin light chain junction region [Macaca mulatta]MPO05374.1 immunoglobulin light chain junction region [Macaca mulatta]